MTIVSGKALAAGNIEADLNGALPAASALPLTFITAASGLQIIRPRRRHSHLRVLDIAGPFLVASS